LSAKGDNFAKNVIASIMVSCFCALNQLAIWLRGGAVICDDLGDIRARATAEQRQNNCLWPPSKPGWGLITAFGSKLDPERILKSPILDFASNIGDRFSGCLAKRTL
jgi:hypothetical protein